MYVFWFIVVVTFVNLFLSILWSKSSFANVLLKMYFILAVVVGVAILYHASPEEIKNSISEAKQIVGETYVKSTIV